MTAGRGGRLAGVVGSWWAALRIARREARRARGRTALVLAMITLPVLVLTFTAVSWDMSDLTRAERNDRQLGTADAELLWVARGPVFQDAWGEGWGSPGDNLVPAGPVTAAQVTALLPAGSRVVPLRRWVAFDARVGERVVGGVTGREVDLADPLGRGLARFHSGRAPAGPDEIAASPAALRRLDVRPGGTVTSGDGARSWRVVGVAEYPDDLGPVVTLYPSTEGRAAEPESSWLVDLPGGVDEALFRRLNEQGVVVRARTPAPPSGTGSPPFATSTGMDVEGMSVSVLVGGLGLLEVVLLVGPAFAVGVRRRRRDLALVAVAGGDDAHLRRIVLADGVVLGALGAATGVTLGVAAAFAGRPLVEQHLYGARFGGYRCWPEALVAIAAVAVLTGVLAALAPAWAAARQDVVAGLAGRRVPPAHRRRWPVAGLALTVGGAALAAFGAARTAPAVLLVGLILGELGLVLATPTLVGLLARLGRSLPLAPRIALRDASRNRSSAAPAISAVMAAVAGSVAVGAYLASDRARSDAMYAPSLPPGTVLVTLPEDGADPAPDRRGGRPNLEQVAGSARDHLGARTVVPVAEARCGVGADPCSVSPVLPPERACPWPSRDGLGRAEQRRALADARCTGDHAPYGTYFQAVVDDGTVLPALTGAGPAEVAAATAVLRAGGVVVTDPRYVVDGRVDVVVARSGPDGSVAPPPTTVDGYAFRTGLGAQRLLVSPQAADRLGLTAHPVGWAVSADGAPGEERQERFRTALRPFGVQLEFESGGSGDDERPALLLLAAAAGVITLGAAGMATGLAAAEGRADLSTLAAVGAAPGLRRLLSLCQAGVIAVSGSVLGIGAGLGSAVIILTALNRRYAEMWPVQDPYPVLVPWATLGVLLVVPLVAMLGAGLFTRSRLPVERRLD
ncbi:putative ABC transport system permease protein [Micromonospora citrea]|uniref:Putative ABC transport system permease protein n=1 Tax=Micromonospora citrea TaxID=47855 RepID=A0A1C6UBI4_9ACTN|nr:FtsX-like permease family protein [Micromonospora citrea]SCL51314.1 putative ABC transport system permease protein [Micromonospora citrea]